MGLRAAAGPRRRVNPSARVDHLELEAPEATPPPADVVQSAARGVMGCLVSTKEQLSAFLATDLAAGRDDVNLASDSLVDAGIIDSVGILKLVDFIESDLGVKIGDDDLIPENFDTLDDIARLVDGKK